MLSSALGATILIALLIAPSFVANYETYVQGLVMALVSLLAEALAFIYCRQILSLVFSRDTLNEAGGGVLDRA